MAYEINRILVFIEMKDGNVHQVIAEKVQKELALSMLAGEDGKVKVNPTPENFTL